MALIVVGQCLWCGGALAVQAFSTLNIDALVEIPVEERWQEERVCMQCNRSPDAVALRMKKRKAKGRGRRHAA